MILYNYWRFSTSMLLGRSTFLKVWLAYLVNQLEYQAPTGTTLFQHEVVSTQRCIICGQIQHILASGYIHFPFCPTVLKILVPELCWYKNGAIYSKQNMARTRFFNRRRYKPIFSYNSASCLLVNFRDFRRSRLWERILTIIAHRKPWFWA
jgi:hypothetical protein